MPLEILQQPQWIGTMSEQRSIRLPSWNDLEIAIRRLDQDHWQDVYLFPNADDSKTWLCVGGGRGQYIITGSIDAETFPTYVAKPGADGTQVVNVGGQAGEYPVKWVASLEQALSVAQAFYTTGSFEYGIEWERI